MGGENPCPLPLRKDESQKNMKKCRWKLTTGCQFNRKLSLLYQVSRKFCNFGTLIVPRILDFRMTCATTKVWK